MEKPRFIIMEKPRFQSVFDDDFRSVQIKKYSLQPERTETLLSEVVRLYHV